MSAIRVNCSGGSFLVDEDQWDTEKTIEMPREGFFFRRKPSACTWRLKKHTHTSYVCCAISREFQISLHRLLLSATRFQIVDHVNHDGTDNRMENIRLCTVAQNNQNLRAHSHGTSKFVGVTWHKSSKKWEAFVCIGRKKKSLGYFRHELEAAAARDQWVKANRPEFGYLNLPSITE